METQKYFWCKKLSKIHSIWHSVRNFQDTKQQGGKTMVKEKKWSFDAEMKQMVELVHKEITIDVEIIRDSN